MLEVISYLSHLKWAIINRTLLCSTEKTARLMKNELTSELIECGLRLLQISPDDEHSEQTKATMRHTRISRSGLSASFSRVQVHVNVHIQNEDG